MYSAWELSEAHPQTPLTIAGPVSADRFWERITYFLDRVVPVANEYKIRIACHPQDPGVPPAGYQGVNRVLGTVDGLKKFVRIQESPYHGLNFCQGTVSEMLEDRGAQIYDVIRYFGSREKIFMVHFRNIKGGFLNFEEVYPDNGDVHMYKAMKIYHELGYQGMFLPDHHQGFSHHVGVVGPHGRQSVGNGCRHTKRIGCDMIGNAVRRFGRKHRNSAVVELKTAFNMVGLPRADFFVFSDAVRIFAGMAKCRLISFAWNPASYGNHHQSKRASNSRISPKSLAKHIETRIHANPATDGPINK
jgi:hypothetical protein